MDNIKNILEEMGLNHFESSIYLQLLYKGEQAASVVARAASMPRSTTRGILDKLCERGIVRKVYKRNTQFYACKPPEALKLHLENVIAEKQRSVEHITEVLPLLNSFYDKQNIAPKVQVFEGSEQVIEAFNRSLFEEKTKELLIFTSYEFLKDPLIRKNDDDFFIKMRIKKGIPARVLVGKTSESSKMIKKAPKELRERRFIPPNYALPGNIHIYGNSVLYFSTKKGEYLAVLIEGGQVAETMKTLFEFMWEKV